MRVFKTLVLVVTNGEERPELVDTILHEQQLWLVPRWTYPQSPPAQRPERIVRPASKRQVRESGDAEADYVLDGPVPRSVLYGLVPQEVRDEYIVEMEPEIYLRQF